MKRYQLIILFDFRDFYINFGNVFPVESQKLVH